MAFNCKNAILCFILAISATSINVIYACVNTALPFNDLTHLTDASLKGRVIKKIPDEVFSDQTNSYGFTFEIECLYQNSEGRNSLLLTNTTVKIFGGGSRGTGVNCHNVSVEENKQVLIFVNRQNDGKLVAMYVAYDGIMVEEITMYCYLKMRTIKTGGDTCEPVLTKEEKCTGYNESKQLFDIPENPKPRQTTAAPTPEPEPPKTTANPDPGYTVKGENNGENQNPKPVNPGTKGGQTVKDGSGAGIASLSSSLGLFSLLSFSLVFF